MEIIHNQLPGPPLFGSAYAALNPVLTKVVGPKKDEKSGIVDATLGSTADIFGRGRRLARHQIDRNKSTMSFEGV